MSKLTRWEAAAASRGSRAQHTSTRRAHTAFVWQPSPQPRCPLPSRAAVRCGQQVLRDLAGHHCSDGQATRVPGQHHSASPTPRRLGNRFAPLRKLSAGIFSARGLGIPLKSQHRLQSIFNFVPLLPCQGEEHGCRANAQITLAGVTEEQYTSQLSSAHRPVRAPEARVGLLDPVPPRAR